MTRGKEVTRETRAQVDILHSLRWSQRGISKKIEGFSRCTTEMHCSRSEQPSEQICIRKTVANFGFQASKLTIEFEEWQEVSSSFFQENQCAAATREDQ